MYGPLLTSNKILSSVTYSLHQSIHTTVCLLSDFSSERKKKDFLTIILFILNYHFNNTIFITFLLLLFFFFFFLWEDLKYYSTAEKKITF